MFQVFNAAAVIVIALNLVDGREFFGNAPKVEGCWDLGVAIQVSPLVTTTVPRQLEVSWWNAVSEPGDFVGLYDTEPASGVTPLYQVPVTVQSGYGLSAIQAPTTVSEELGYIARCLGYWVAYVRGAEVLASDCLRTLPTWLSDEQAEIGDMQLDYMFLPGTHNSASYRRYPGSGSENIIVKYTYTQEEDILAQLIFGARYVDIRIGYYSSQADPWWTNHGVSQTHPFRDIVEQVKAFIYNTNEIVIFDIHEFTGFGSNMDIHNQFVAVLQEELGSYMVPASLTWDATLNEVWASGRRLIVTYNDDRVWTNSDNLWRAVQHRWGNVQSLDDLYNYFTDAITWPANGRAHSMMAELTATALDTATDRLGGLRKMADNVNRNVTVWFRGTWGETVNIVATDFFRGTDIIEESIAWNLRRAANIPCGPPPASLAHAKK